MPAAAPELKMAPLGEHAKNGKLNVSHWGEVGADFNCAADVNSAALLGPLPYNLFFGLVQSPITKN